MASESVNIVIDGDASGALEAIAQTRESMKSLGKGAHEVESSAAIFAQLASAFGGEEIAHYVLQVEHAATKLKMLAAMTAKAGVAGLAFKAGLAGLALYLGVTLGKKLGEIIFQTETWKEGLREAANEVSEMAARTNELKRVAADFKFEQIQFIRNPQKQAQELAAYRDDLQSSMLQINDQIQKQKSVVQSYQDSWIASDEETKLEEARLKAMESEFEMLNKVSGAVSEETIARKDKIKALQEEQAEYQRQQAAGQSFLAGLTTSVQSFENEEQKSQRQREERWAKLQAWQDSGASAADYKAALNAIKELNKLEDAAKQEKDDKQAGEDEAKARKAELKEYNDLYGEQASMRATMLEKMQLQTEELTKGKDAARLMKLEMDGLSESEAKSVLEFEKLFEEQSKKKDLEQTELQTGGESRFLSGRGNENDPNKLIEDLNKQNNTLTSEQLAVMRESKTVMDGMKAGIDKFNAERDRLGRLGD